MKALIIIDMQNDFVANNGSARVAEAAASIPVIQKALAGARQKGWPVFHVIRAHNPDGSDAELFRRNHFAQGKGICVKGSWGAQIVPGLEPLPGEFVVIKTRFSGFYATDLENLLKASNVDEVWLCGTQYPNCVRGTAMDALYRDFRVGIISNGCSAQTATVAEANLQDMSAMAITCLPLEQSPLA